MATRWHVTVEVECKVIIGVLRDHHLEFSQSAMAYIFDTVTPIRKRMFEIDWCLILPGGFMLLNGSH